MIRFKLFILLLAVAVHPLSVKSQEVVDETIAWVSDGSNYELITRSDLVWQLALIPGVKIDPPDSANLNQSLQLVVRQRLIALEAKRLPRENPTNDEIESEIKRILDQFPSSENFVSRLRSVGFDSAADENLQRIISDRIAIEKYVEFRFRSFVVITAEEEESYYRDEFVPKFRKENPDGTLPVLDQVRDQITLELTEARVEQDIESFLDEAATRTEVVILNEV